MKARWLGVSRKFDYIIEPEDNMQTLITQMQTLITQSHHHQNHFTSHLLKNILLASLLGLMIGIGFVIIYYGIIGMGLSGA